MSMTPAKKTDFYVVQLEKEAAQRKAARAMLAVLAHAVQFHGPFGDDSRPAWWQAACAAIAAADAAGIKSEE